MPVMPCKQVIICFTRWETHLPPLLSGSLLSVLYPFGAATLFFKDFALLEEIEWQLI